MEDGYRDPEFSGSRFQVGKALGMGLVGSPECSGYANGAFVGKVRPDGCFVGGNAEIFAGEACVEKINVRHSMDSHLECIGAPG